MAIDFNKKVQTEYTQLVNKLEELKNLENTYKRPILDFQTFENLKKMKMDFLLTLFQFLNPEWKENYNKLEQKKHPNISISLGKNFKIGDIKKNIERNSIVESAFIAHMANKIAHSCETQFKSGLLFIKDTLPYNHNTSQILERNFNELTVILSKYINPNNENDSQTLDYLKKEALNLGIPVQTFEELVSKLKENNFQILVKCRQEAFYIKSTETSKLLELLSQKENTINYGIYSPNNNRKEYILIMDVPFHGQISMHIVDSTLIKQLYKHPKYNPKYYFERLTSIFPPSIMSEKAKEVFNGREKIPIEELQQQEDRKFAHYLAIMSGYTTEEFHKLFPDITQQSRTSSSLPSKPRNRSNHTTYSKQSKTKRNPNSPLTQTIQIPEEFYKGLDD